MPEGHIWLAAEGGEAGRRRRPRYWSGLAFWPGGPKAGPSTVRSAWRRCSSIFDEQILLRRSRRPEAGRRRRYRRSRYRPEGAALAHVLAENRRFSALGGFERPNVDTFGRENVREHERQRERSSGTGWGTHRARINVQGFKKLMANNCFFF